MKRQEKTIVRKIEWFNNESEMILTCDILNGALSYSTNLAISGSHLNQVLSNLQKQAHEFDVNDCMRIEQCSVEDVSFIFDFSTISNIEFYFNQPFEYTNLRQIRA